MPHSATTELARRVILSISCAFALCGISAAGFAAEIPQTPQGVAIALVHQSCDPRRSTVVSPASAEELLSVFSHGTDEPLTSRLTSLAADLSEPLGSADDVSMHVGVWVPTGLTLTSSFESQVTEHYHADVFYRSKDASTEKSLEKWLGSTTKGLLNAPRVSDDSFVIASSLLLAARWREPFDPRSTHTGTFHGVTGDRPERFMDTERVFDIANAADSRIVRLDLGSAESVEFLLPSDPKKSPCDALRTYVAESEPIFVRRLAFVSLPRFQTTTDWFSLVPTLRVLGVGALIDPRVSPLTHVVQQRPIYFAHVRQSSTISVDESGVVGAAATVADVPLKSPNIGFKFKRPFAFVVRNPKSGVIILAGVYQ